MTSFYSTGSLPPGRSLNRLVDLLIVSEQHVRQPGAPLPRGVRQLEDPQLLPHRSPRRLCCQVIFTQRRGVSEFPDEDF